jgi:hypothetical protein
MDRVFTFADQPVEAGHWVVVAVGEPTSNQRHIGIMHRDRNAHLQFLHLAWHCRLRNDDNRPDYLASSAESVGEDWLGQVAELVIQG